jgi:hypothetical protein
MLAAGDFRAAALARLAAVYAQSGGVITLAKEGLSGPRIKELLDFRQLPYRGRKCTPKAL